MSNKFDKQCRALARQLPVVYTKVKKTIPEKGSDLIKVGTRQDKDGYDIIPGNIYNRTIELQLPINHADRIKRIYKAKGEQGVADYIKWAKGAAKWQEKAVKETLQQKQPTTLIQKIKNFIWKMLNRQPEPVQVKEELPSIRA